MREETALKIVALLAVAFVIGAVVVMGLPDIDLTGSNVPLIALGVLVLLLTLSGLGDLVRGASSGESTHLVRGLCKLVLATAVGAGGYAFLL